MQQQWTRPIMLLLGILALLVPGVRRMAFQQILKNRLLRNFGLKLIISLPFVREKILGKMLPTR
jgi:hypothetical protein